MSCEAVSITRMDGQRLYLSIKADKEVSVKAKVNQPEWVSSKI